MKANTGLGLALVALIGVAWWQGLPQGNASAAKAEGASGEPARNITLSHVRTGHGDGTLCSFAATLENAGTVALDHPIFTVQWRRGSAAVGTSEFMVRVNGIAPGDRVPFTEDYLCKDAKGSDGYDIAARSAMQQVRVRIAS